VINEEASAIGGVCDCCLMANWFFEVGSWWL
jgi:hypothetical protein